MATCPSQQTTRTLRGIPTISMFNLRSRLYLLLEANDANPPDSRAGGGDAVRQDHSSDTIYGRCGTKKGGETHCAEANSMYSIELYVTLWSQPYFKGQISLGNHDTQVWDERGRLTVLFAVLALIPKLEQYSKALSYEHANSMPSFVSCYRAACNATPHPRPHGIVVGMKSIAAGHGY